MNAVVVVTQDMKDKNMKSERNTYNKNIHAKLLSNKDSKSFRKKRHGTCNCQERKGGNFLKKSYFNYSRYQFE